MNLVVDQSFLSILSANTSHVAMFHQIMYQERVLYGRECLKGLVLSIITFIFLHIILSKTDGAPFFPVVDHSNPSKF